MTIFVSLTIVKLCLIKPDEMHWNAFKRFCKAQDPLEKVLGDYSMLVRRYMMLPPSPDTTHKWWLVNKAFTDRQAKKIEKMFPRYTY